MTQWELACLTYPQFRALKELETAEMLDVLTKVWPCFKKCSKLQVAVNV